MTNNTLVCDPTCERAQCTFGYRPEEEYTKCGMINWEISLFSSETFGFFSSSISIKRW